MTRCEDKAPHKALLIMLRRLMERKHASTLTSVSMCTPKMLPPYCYIYYQGQNNHGCGLFRNTFFLKTVTTFTLCMVKWWNLKQALVPPPSLLPGPWQGCSSVLTELTSLGKLFQHRHEESLQLQLLQHPPYLASPTGFWVTGRWELSFTQLLAPQLTHTRCWVIKR